MIWGVVLVSLIAGGTIGFVICGLLTAEAINDRDEEIQRLQKDIKLERLQQRFEKLKEG